MVRLIACSTLLHFTFYPVALYVLPCCTVCSTLLQNTPITRERISWNKWVRTVGTVATELLFLPATLLRLGRNVAGKIVNPVIVSDKCVCFFVIPGKRQICRLLECDPIGNGPSAGRSSPGSSAQHSSMAASICAVYTSKQRQRNLKNLACPGSCSTLLQNDRLTRGRAALEQKQVFG